MTARPTLATFALAASLGVSSMALAGEAGKPAPTKEQAATAGKKFREGELLFTRHDYPRAAKLFEEAYAIAPHPDALLNAIEAREKAGDLLLAARLCERLRKDYPTDKSANEEVAERIARLTPKLGRLELVVKSGVSNVEVDSDNVDGAAVWWVDPGDHTVAASAALGPIQRNVNVVAGAKQNVVLEAAAAGAEKPVTPPAAKPADDGKPLHPAFFFVGLGLTLGAGGVLAWSSLDTADAYDAFDQVPTREGLDDGLSRQLRTNVLIGVTAGLGVATAAVGIFATEWSTLGSSETALRFEASPGFASLAGRFQ